MKYLETDEKRDVLVSLQELAHQLDRVDDDIWCWKWAIMAACSAAAGVLVCNLSGSMQIGALNKQAARGTIEAFEHHRKTDRLELPKQVLAPPSELLLRASSSDRREYAGPPLAISAEAKEAFKKIFEIRNEFVHFKPQSWLIEVSGLPQLLRQVMSIVAVANVDGWSFRHLNDCDQTTLTAILDQIDLRLVQLHESRRTAL